MTTRNLGTLLIREIIQPVIPLKNLPVTKATLNRNCEPYEEVR